MRPQAVRLEVRSVELVRTFAISCAKNRIMYHLRLRLYFWVNLSRSSVYSLLVVCLSRARFLRESKRPFSPRTWLSFLAQKATWRKSIKTNPLTGRLKSTGQYWICPCTWGQSSWIDRFWYAWALSKMQQAQTWSEEFSGSVNSNARDLARKCTFFMSASTIFLKALAYFRGQNKKNSMFCPLNWAVFRSNGKGL